MLCFFDLFVHYQNMLRKLQHVKKLCCIQLEFEMIKLLFFSASRVMFYKFVSFFQLLNNGPSQISHTLLELRCPLSVQGHTLLYPLEFFTEGPINCTSDKNMNHKRLKVSVWYADVQLSGPNEAKYDSLHLPLIPSQIYD